MTLIHPDSLALTLDAVNAALFDRVVLDPEETREVARWIAARQGQPGAYLGMCAPTPQDLATGARVFTGEKLPSNASIRHVLGEESCRVLRLLAVKEPEVTGALERASDSLLLQLVRAQGRGEYPEGFGKYCCPTCTVGYWRHLSAGGFDSSQTRLAVGVAWLANRREPSGRWTGFPFFYTLLALSGMPQDLGRETLRQTTPLCEKLLERGFSSDVYGKRRQTLLERVLGVV
jgi:hypothetical protein